MQYLHNVKLSTRDKEEYTGHENIWDWWNPVWLPGLSFAQIIPLLWCFYHFWSSFIEVKVLNELHSTTVLTHHRMFACILLRNKILFSLKWSQKPACPILLYSLVVNIFCCNTQKLFTIQYFTVHMSYIYYIVYNNLMKIKVTHYSTSSEPAIIII